MHSHLEGYPTTTVYSKRVLLPSATPEGTSFAKIAWFYLCLIGWLLPPLLFITLPFIGFAILRRRWIPNASGAKLRAAQAKLKNKTL